MEELVKLPSMVRAFRPRENGRKTDESPSVEESREQDRQQWANSTEFLLSCVSMSVGLGNVWRFPFTAYENGGGAFLLPYLVVLLLIGRPLYLLELGLGQFSGGGCVSVWRLAPGLAGVGYGQVLSSACVVSYYCSLIGLSFYYLVVSCQSTLPWTICHPELEDPEVLCVPTSGLSAGHNDTDPVLLPASNSTPYIASSEQYFKAGVLKEVRDMSVEGLGPPDASLGLCLLVTWLLIFLALCRGVRSSGKMAYFTALFPYLVMAVLLVRGLTLPGATKGLVYFFTPQWERLLEPGVWYAAVTQSFFSLGVGFGVIVTYSSYNKFHHNSYRDALIISIADTLTSILAGTIIFAILGHLSHELGVPITQVVRSGAGLAFVSYPEVIAKFDVAPQLFSVLFFLMLITLGLGSAMGMISNIIRVVCDALPARSRLLITASICLLGLLSGLLYVTPGGQGLLGLVDYYGGSLLVLALALVEVVGVAWVYGVSTIIRDLNIMLNRNLGWYWRLCWGLVAPVVLAVILGYSVSDYTPVTHNHTPLPVHYQVSGWLITVLGFMFVPVFILINIYRKGFKLAFRDVSGWRPAREDDCSYWRKCLDTTENPFQIELKEEKSKKDHSEEDRDRSMAQKVLYPDIENDLNVTNPGL